MDRQLAARQDKRNQDHITHYPARTRRPLTAYPLTGDGHSRVIPGGALVTITENTAPVTERHDPDVTVRTATVTMDGVPYETEILPDQFTPYQPTTNQ